MGNNRRDFTKAGFLGRAAATPGAFEPEQPAAAKQLPRPIHLLVLGGTGFIGPHLVREATYHAMPRPAKGLQRTAIW